MNVTAWLLEGDPAIRWQVMRDLLDAPAEEVAAERSLVAREGWGARLLALQQDSGQWGEGVYSPKWTSTTYTLLQLRDLGIDPDDATVVRAIGRVDAGITMGGAGRPFFGYRGETCVTGLVLGLSGYFGVDRGVSEVVGFLVGEQLADGGWNCEAARSGSLRSSFNTTLSVLEGLVAFERRFGADPAVTAARLRGAGYLLDRRLRRRLSDGEIVKPRWDLFSFPTRWHYDVLRALDHLQDAGADRDERATEALDLVVKKRSKDGTWPLQNHHRGLEHFRMEEPGAPSRWNTLRALRVLRWAGRE